MNDFVRGYFCAASVCFRQYQDRTIVEEMLQSEYTSIDQLIKEGVEEYDIEVLKPVLAEIERKRTLSLKIVDHENIYGEFDS